jgi:hypothetical protein
MFCPRPGKVLRFPLSVLPPSAAAELLQPQRWGAKPAGLTTVMPRLCGSVDCVLAVPAKQPGTSPGCGKISLCDLTMSGYSVPEGVRDDKFSFILQLAI